MTDEQFLRLTSILENIANTNAQINADLLFIIGTLSALCVCLILYSFIKKCIGG